MGWLKDSADWVGEKAGAAKDAVVNGAKAVKETAGEAWDVVTSTDLGWEDGIISLETDLDEIMDLLPTSLQQSLMLDRAAAANRVKVSFDTSNNELTVSSKEIQLSGVKSAQLDTGPVHLTDLNVVVSNHEGGLPFVPELSILGHKVDKKDNPAVHATAGGATADNVVWKGDGGPVSVAKLILEGFSGDIVTQGGMPGAGGKTTAGFVLEHAILEGLKREGVSIERAEVVGLKGGLDEGKETAYLEAQAIRANKTSAGGAGAEFAAVSGVRLDVENEGGGLPFLDDKPDHITGHGRVKAAEVAEFSGMRSTADRTWLGGMSGHFDVDKGEAGGRVDELHSRGFDSAWVGVKSLDIADAQAAATHGSKQVGDSLDIQAGKVTADGINYSPQAPDHKKRDRTDAPPLRWSAGVDDLDLSHVQTTDTSLASASVDGAQASGLLDRDKSWYHVEAEAAKVKALKHQEIGVDGMAVQHPTLDGGMNEATMAAQSAELTGVKTEHFQAAKIGGERAKATLQSGGGIHGSMAKATIDDALIAGRIGIKHGQVSGINAGHAGDVSSASVQKGAFEGLSDTSSGATLDRLDAEGGNVVLRPDATIANIQQAHATGLKAGDGHLESGDVAGLSVTTNKAGVDATADKLAIHNGGYGAYAGAAEAGATGIRATTSASGVNVSAQGVSAQDLDVMERGHVGELSAKGYEGRFGGALTTMSVDAMAAKTVSDKPTGAKAGTLGMTSGRLSVGDGRTQFAAQALVGNALSMGRTGAATSASLSGVTVDHGENGTAAGFDQAAAAGLRFEAGRTAGVADAVSASQGHVLTGKAGTDARLGGVHADGLVTQTTPSGASKTSRGATGPSGGATSDVDVARLVETGAARVQDAHVTAQAALNPGKVAGALDVKKGTTVSAEATIADNKFVPSGTHAKTNKPVSGPLWTSVDGAHVNKKGELIADVNGWFDQNAGKDLNKKLGIGGKKLPGLAALGHGIAGQMRGSRGQSQSKKGHGKGKEKPILDPRQGSLKADVSLSAGTIDAGQAGALTLGRAQSRTDNTASVTAAAKDGLRVASPRVLAASGRMDAGKTGVTVGQTSVTDAELVVKPDGTVGTSVGAVDAQNLHIGTGAYKPKTAPSGTSAPVPRKRPTFKAKPARVAGAKKKKAKGKTR